MALFESLVEMLKVYYGIMCFVFWTVKLVSIFSVIKLVNWLIYYFFILSKIGCTCSKEGRFPGSSFIQIRMNFAMC